MVTHNPMLLCIVEQDPITDVHALLYTTTPEPDVPETRLAEATFALSIGDADQPEQSTTSTRLSAVLNPGILVWFDVSKAK